MFACDRHLCRHDRRYELFRWSMTKPEVCRIGLPLALETSDPYLCHLLDPPHQLRHELILVLRAYKQPNPKQL